MTLETSTRPSDLVIASASRLIEAVPSIRDAAHDGQEAAVAHTFLEKVCPHGLDNVMEIAIRLLSDTPAGRQRKMILERGVMVGVPPELVLEEELLTQPPLMRPPSRLQHPALQRGSPFDNAASRQSSPCPEHARPDFLSGLAGAHIADSPRRIAKPS
jgi:hypothetical protein